MTQTDKQAHTPGPWQVSPGSVTVPFSAHSLAIIRREGGYIARAIHRPGAFRPEAEANACLIAAAPDLLEACEAVGRLLKPPGYPVLLSITERQAIVAAIAKAKGVSP